MVDFEKIRDVMQALQEHLHCLVILAEQGHDKPDYPFATFKILSGTARERYQDPERMLSVPDDVTKSMTVSTSRMFSILSMTFYDTDYPRILGIAQKAMEYFLGCADAPVGIRVVTPTLQDRTTLSVNEYEHRLGFDVRIEEAMERSHIDDAVGRVGFEGVAA